MLSGKTFCNFIFSIFILGQAAPPTAQAAPPTAQAGNAADRAALEQAFLRLPPEARRHIGPLYWLHGDESPKRLSQYVDVIAAGGNGTFTAESRPHSDWLGPAWYRDLDICLKAARKNDLQMWIFDEKWWPSQMVGGAVPAKFGSKFLEADRTDINGPRRFKAKGFSGPNFITAVAGRATAGKKIDAASLVDLKPRIKDGCLTWDVPEGRWSVLRFTWRYAGAKGHQKKWISVDGASRDCVDWFINYVYQPHYDHFGDDFGKTIQGFFYDEPETQGDFGTELLPELARRGVDWKPVLTAWKFELSNPEAQTSARYQYRDAFAEAWGRTLYGGMSRWCRAHHVRSMGHFMEHGRLYLHPTFCAGNMFQLQKYSDMGAIDLVCRQMYPGQRPHDIYQTPKLASSISHVYGKENDDAMCEIFGGYGQQLTYSQMKWLVDQHEVRGVNFFIPHSFNPKSPHDHDYPPYFYDSGLEPRFPLYHVFADYTSRLSLMLTGGRHVCPVALMFLGQSYHAGKSITPEDMTTALQDAQYDCDWLPYDAFRDNTVIKDRRLQLHQERYSVLIVPAVEVIPFDVLVKVKEFFDAGGVVAGYGILPSRSATPGRTSADITALRNAIWGESPSPGTAVCKTGKTGGRSYFLPEKPAAEEITRVLAMNAGIPPVVKVLEGKTDGWLHVLHRVKGGSDVFFIANQQHEGPAKKFLLQLRADGVPECWDAMRGQIRRIPFDRVDKKTVELTLGLEPLESTLIVFQPTARPLPVRLTPDAEPCAPPITVTRIATPQESKPAAQSKSNKNLLTGCRWIWHAADPAEVPPEARYFRGKTKIPAGRSVKEASLRITADNDFTVYLNGKKAGAGTGGMEDWRHPRTIQIGGLLHPGRNTLAIEAVNFGDAPNPAGLIGACRILLDNGTKITYRIDKSWRSTGKKVDGWQAADFDDSAWAHVRELAAYGGGTWGKFESRKSGMTLPAVRRADPLAGRFTLTADLLKNGRRVYIETGGIPHEAAAAVSVNDRYAGGFIGRPYRLDITGAVHPGENTIKIEPFAPQDIRITVYRQ